MLTVVAALIEHAGKLLVCQRRRSDTFGLLWEFPGGKVEPGETPPQALARELREELGIDATIGAEIYRTQHKYSQLSETIDLIFFAASAEPSAIENLAFESLAWLAPADLPTLDFLPADRDLIEKLASGAIALPINRAHFAT
jgi:8-oxo-dGTP diphosphatase